MSDTNHQASQGHDKSMKDEPISAEEAAQIRHDEPVTAQGILRSLLMANEPSQRMESLEEDKPNQ
ncbi:MAG: hypothetical protein ACQKBU_00325 [Verrucomicrobiales bacterium]